MSSTGSCDGFLTLNQSILVVVISGAVVMMAFIVIAIVSVQYHQLATQSKKGKRKPCFFVISTLFCATYRRIVKSNGYV